MKLAEVLNILDKAKRDHYSEPEGLHSCPAVQPQGSYSKCECGADETNAELDRVIRAAKDQWREAP